MHEWAGRLPGGSLTAAGDDRTAEGEFDARLADSSALAFRVAFSVLRHRQDAEDVAQDVFVRAHARLHRLRDRERFRAWLVRISWRMALDRIRGERRRAAHEERAAPPDLAPMQDDPAAQLRASRLWAAIDRLPEKLRLVVVLGAIEGYDTKEVAALVGAPEGTVKSRLFEARRRLHEFLK